MVVVPIATRVLAPSDDFRKSRRWACAVMVVASLRNGDSSKLILGRREDQGRGLTQCRLGIFGLRKRRGADPPPERGVETVLDEQIDEEAGSLLRGRGVVLPRRAAGSSRRPRAASSSASNARIRLVRLSIVVELAQAVPPSQPATLGGA